MKWIDTADDTAARVQAKAAERGQVAQVRMLTREAYLTLTPEQRSPANIATIIRGVNYRGDASAPWLLVTRRDLEGPEAWNLYDCRDATRPPVPLIVSVPDLRLTQKIGALAAVSRGFRLLLGAGMVGLAAVAGLVDAWRREKD